MGPMCAPRDKILMSVLEIVETQKDKERDHMTIACLENKGCGVIRAALHALPCQEQIVADVIGENHLFFNNFFHSSVCFNYVFY